MHIPFLGEILREMGLLTEQQVDQILEQQRYHPQKFGQIAVRLGFVTPQQVWEAWARQMGYRRQYVDVADLGIDTTAVERVSVSTARALGIVPLRLWGDHLVVAGPPDLSPDAVQHLAEQTNCQVHTCISFPENIRFHLDRLDDLVQAESLPVAGLPVC